jgi:hypothetical protein
MSFNLEVPQFYIDQCTNGIPQGMDMSTYLKPCFFIYEQSGENGIIRIEDKSMQVSFYDSDTDTHEVFVTIYDDAGIVCFTQSLTPFENLSLSLPREGCYTVEIDVRYTILYDGPDDTTIEHTFQNVYMYPVCWERCGDYHNTLLYDITCRISKLQCEINKRSCVGRDYHDLQQRVFMLNNYLYAICNFCLTAEQFDQIACKVKTIKKAC